MSTPPAAPPTVTLDTSAPAAPAAAPTESFLGTAPPAPAVTGTAPAAAAPLANPYPATDWRHSLPPEIVGEESLKPFNDVQALAKSYLHTKKLVGADKVALPSKHATDEDYQKFYDSLGRPKLEEYKVELPKDAKYLDASIVEKITPLAHKLGVMPTQINELLKFYEADSMAAAQTMEQEQVTQIKQGITDLKKEWGVAFDQKASWAKRFVAENGGPELTKFFNENKTVDFNPHLIKLLAKAGEAMYKEDSISTGQTPGNLLTPAEAQIKINTIVSDSKHPYHDSGHPNHKAALQEVTDLYTQLYPKQAQEA